MINTFAYNFDVPGLGEIQFAVRASSREEADEELRRALKVDAVSLSDPGSSYSKVSASFTQGAEIIPKRIASRDETKNWTDLNG